MSPASTTQTAVCAMQPPPPHQPQLGLKPSAPNSHFINQDDLSPREFISLPVQHNSGTIVLSSRNRFRERPSLRLMHGLDSSRGSGCAHTETLNSDSAALSVSAMSA